MRLTATLLTLLSCFSFLHAQESPKPEMSKEEMQTAYEQHVATILKGITYKESSAPLPGGMATLNLPEGYRFINKSDTKKVLEDLWGNPPGTADEVLGLVVPKGEDLANPDCWAIVASFEDSGYVSDKDADEINYDDLLKTLKEHEKANNEERSKQGYETLTLEGWALAPHYDKEHRVLYWAKNLKAGSGSNSLNYDMRVLGRRGILSLNAVSGMERLNDVEKATPEIVGMAKFNEGHRYLDFNPKTDKVSKLGLAGLVLGGAAVAAKTGLFKGIWLAILAGKKFVIMGFVAVAGFFKRMFGKKNEA